MSTQQLDDRIDQLMFLAEAITEQTQRLDDVQSKYWRQLRKIARRQSHSGKISNTTSESRNSSFASENCGLLQDQLTALQIKLAKKEEKLRAQTKSLALRFKSERAQLQLEKMELEPRRAKLYCQPHLLNVKRIGSEAQQAETSQSKYNENPFRETGITAGYSDGSESDDNLSSISAIEDRLSELRELLANSEAENHTLFSENQSLRDQLSSNSQNCDFDQRASQLGELFDTRRQLERTLEQLQDARGEIARLKASDVDEAAAETTWEEQKKRLLASLEGDVEPTLENPREFLQRLKKAEDLLTQKDHTIAQLETLLISHEETDRNTIANEVQSQHKKILDCDAVIAMERNRLAELEQHWQDKIGKAEMELSQERSRLSRDRAELEAKSLELEKKANETIRSSDSVDSPKEPRKRRWMERLGL